MRMGQKIFVRDEMEYTLEENFSINKEIRSITWGLNRNCSISAMWIMPVCVQTSHVVFLFPGSHLHPMKPGNSTRISEFLLLGLSEEQELQPLIFGLFFCMYLITVFGNLLIILAISSDYHLHTPMYFFLSNLSFVDLCFISTTIPKMLWNIQTQRKDITYEGCITQMYFYILFAGLDDILLSVMAYDRYVAICHPLHYMVIMSPRLCGLLCLVPSALWTTVSGTLGSECHVFLVTQINGVAIVLLSRFGNSPLFLWTLSGDTTCQFWYFLNNMMIYLAIFLLGSDPFAGILYTYSKIVSCSGAV